MSYETDEKRLLSFCPSLLQGVIDTTPMKSLWNNISNLTPPAIIMNRFRHILVRG